MAHSGRGALVDDSAMDDVQSDDDGEPAPFCPAFHHAVELIGRRWSGAIIRAMLVGRDRFSEIAAAIPGLSDRLLSERLKELELAGIVARSVIPETPVRIEYHLTDKGDALAEVFAAISAWADRFPGDGPQPAEAMAARGGSVGHPR